MQVSPLATFVLTLPRYCPLRVVVGSVSFKVLDFLLNRLAKLILTTTTLTDYKETSYPEKHQISPIS